MAVVVAQPGSIVLVNLPGTIVQGKFGTIVSITPRKQRWPELYVVVMDAWMEAPSDELVEELHLAAGEFRLVG